MLGQGVLVPAGENRAGLSNSQGNISRCHFERRFCHFERSEKS